LAENKKIKPQRATFLENAKEKLFMRREVQRMKHRRLE